MGKIKQFIYCKTFGLHEWDFTQMPTHIEYPKDVFRVELRSNVYCTKCNKRMEVCDTYERGRYDLDWDIAWKESPKVIIKKKWYSKFIDRARHIFNMIAPIIFLALVLYKIIKCLS